MSYLFPKNQRNRFEFFLTFARLFFTFYHLDLLLLDTERKFFMKKHFQY